MPYITGAIVLLVIPMLALFAIGCATQESPVERALRIEPMLSAAGFRATPADTPARKAQLQGMTPLEIRFTPREGKMLYWFADPYHCRCVFSGNQEAYEAFERAREQKQVANQEEITEEMNQAAAQETMTFMTSPANEIFY
jgi:hypothetical protein